MATEEWRIGHKTVSKLLFIFPVPTPAHMFLALISPAVKDFWFSPLMTLGVCMWMAILAVILMVAHHFRNDRVSL